MVPDGPRAHTALSSSGQQPSRARALPCSPSLKHVRVPRGSPCTLGQRTPASRGRELSGDTAGSGEPSFLISGSSVLSTEPSPGMAASEMDIAVIAGMQAGRRVRGETREGLRDLTFLPAKAVRRWAGDSVSVRKRPTRHPGG